MQPSPILEIILIAILDVVMLGAIDVHTCEAPTPVIATPGADGAAAPGPARCESRSYSCGHPSGDRRPPPRGLFVRCTAGTARQDPGACRQPSGPRHRRTRCGLHGT